MNIVQKPGEYRSEGQSVQDMMKNEKVPVPSALLEEDYTYMGSDNLPVERWTSQESHEQEKKTVWQKTWQMACRLEDIPKVGDHVLYEINDEIGRAHV